MKGGVGVFAERLSRFGHQKLTFISLAVSSTRGDKCGVCIVVCVVALRRCHLPLSARCFHVLLSIELLFPQSSPETSDNAVRDGVAFLRE